MKWIGAVLIAAGCCGVGLGKANAHRVEVKYLAQIIQMLQITENELSCMLWPLPQLMRNVAARLGGYLAKILADFAQCMEDHAAADPAGCLRNALEKEQKIPGVCRGYLEEYGQCLGRYDLAGQMRELENCLLYTSPSPRD